jgi:hypothetical protein
MKFLCEKFVTEMSADEQTAITPVRHDTPFGHRSFVMDRVEAGFVMMTMTSLVVLVGALAAMVLT